MSARAECLLALLPAALVVAAVWALGIYPLWKAGLVGLLFFGVFWLLISEPYATGRERR